MFTNQTDDPWYSAHVRFANMSTGGLEGSMDWYSADEPASILACTTQHQFCNSHLPADRGCTSLGSYADAQSEGAAIWSNTKQASTLNWFEFPIFRSEIQNIVIALGVAGLSSRLGLSRGIQSPIPNNQWQLDVEHWFKASLASLQGWFVESATGPSDPRIMRWMERPSTETESSICRNQVSVC